MTGGSRIALLAASLVALSAMPVRAQAGRSGAARDTAKASTEHARHAAAACASKSGRERVACDSAFAAMQTRGHAAMGVDQYTSSHVFDNLPDGGRIELQRDVEDQEGVAAIRAHLQHIAHEFGAGNFDIPGFVHAQDVPGANVMADRRQRIRYEFRPLPRGGEVRITTTDAEALHAIHAFMEFQRTDHRAGGEEGEPHEGMDHDAMDHGAMDHDSAASTGGHDAGSGSSREDGAGD